MDEDFKINMDDLKDIVSELFGEKVEKVETKKAKEILEKDTENFIESDLSTENVIKEIFPEEKKEINEEELRKKIELELREKIEAELREKIRKEIEEERNKKRQDLLRQLEESDKKNYKDNKQNLKQTEKDSFFLDYKEKSLILQMFVQSQNILSRLLSKLIKKKAVETMFFKTLEKSIDKWPDVLKKANQDKNGKVYKDGQIEILRILVNVNALSGSEAHKTEKFLQALSDIFEERLIATELAIGIETKNEVVSNIIIQLEKVFNKNKIPQKLQNIFMERVIPSTTLKSED